MKRKTKKCFCIPILEELKKKHIKAMKEKKIGKTQACLLHSLPVIALILVLLYFFKGQFIVALVDNKPIFRSTLIKELEKQAGKNALNAIITKTLILQQAKKEKVEVSSEEVGEEIGKIEQSFSSQGQDLNELLKTKGMTLKDLEAEIRIQQMVEKMASQDIEITEDEIASYIAQRQDFYPQDADPEEIKSQVKEQLKQQKTSEAMELWIQSLHEKANIKYFVEAYKTPSLE